MKEHREHFSTLRTARDPNKVEEVELKSEDLQGMISQLQKIFAL